MTTTSNGEKMSAFDPSQQKNAADFWPPPKLLRLIRDDLPQSDFFALSLASRSIYGIANNILYERISLDLKFGDKGFETLIALDNSLAGNPELVSIVKRLRIKFDGLGNTHNEIACLTKLSTIIGRCLQLENLHITAHSQLITRAATDLATSLDLVPSLSNL